MNHAMEEWLATRPECVQKLAREFPPASPVTVNGAKFIVLGYTEYDELLLWRDGLTYEEAVAEKVTVCAAHLRG